MARTFAYYRADLRTAVLQTHRPSLGTPPPVIPDITEIDDANLGSGLNQFFLFGSWTLVAGAGSYAVTHRYSGVTNDYYEVRFYGVQAVVYGTKGPDHGIAGISIDGGAEVDCDHYQTGGYSDNIYLYQTATLTLGEHIIKVRVKGTKNASSSGFTVSADRIQARLTPLAAPEPEVRDIDDATFGTGQNQFEYSGGPWLEYLAPGNYLGGRRYTDVSGSFYQVRFTGRQFRLFLTLGPNHGIIAVSIDGGAETNVDLFQSAIYTENTRAYTSPDLAPGTHILKVRNTGTKNSNSTGFHGVADRVEVRQTPTVDPLPPPPGGGGGGAPSGTPRLHVDGQYIKDPNGNIIKLHGCAGVFVNDQENFRTGGIVGHINRVCDNPSNGFHSKILRCPIWPGHFQADPIGHINNYVKKFVDYAETKGIYVIIDWHDFGTAQPGSGATTDISALSGRVNQFWDMVGPIFKDRTHVLYELFNEPIQGNQSGGTLATGIRFRDQVQPMVDRLRASAPSTIILVGGPQYAQWMGWVQNNPVAGTNIAYVWHGYPGAYYPDGNGVNQLNPTGWNYNCGFSADVRPFFITEWGYGSDDLGETQGDETTYFNPFKVWVNQRTFSMSAWDADYDYYPVMYMGTDYTTLTGFGTNAKQWIIETHP